VSGASKSGKLADTHPICPIRYLDLGVFAVADATPKLPDAFTPADLLTGIPNAGKARLRLCGTPTAPLAGLARLARR
jgi:hypothetical protein